MPKSTRDKFNALFKVKRKKKPKVVTVRWSEGRSPSAQKG